MKMDPEADLGVLKHVRGCYRYRIQDQPIREILRLSPLIGDHRIRQISRCLV